MSGWRYPVLIFDQTEPDPTRPDLKQVEKSLPKVRTRPFGKILYPNFTRFDTNSKRVGSWLGQPDETQISAANRTLNYNTNLYTTSSITRTWPRLKSDKLIDGYTQTHTYKIQVLRHICVNLKSLNFQELKSTGLCAVETKSRRRDIWKRLAYMYRGEIKKKKKTTHERGWAAERWKWKRARTKK